VVHDLSDFEELVFFAVELEDVSDVFGCFFGLIAVLKLELDRVGVDSLMRGEVYNSFLIFGVFAYKVLIVGGEINNFDIGGDVIEDFGLLEERALNLSQVIELNGIEIHLCTGNQQRQVLLIRRHDSVLDKGVVLGLETFLSFLELLQLFLLVVQVVVDLHRVLQHYDNAVAQFACDHLDNV
jgi:hypothetical protein